MYIENFAIDESTWNVIDKWRFRISTSVTFVRIYMCNYIPICNIYIYTCALYACTHGYSLIHACGVPRKSCLEQKKKEKTPVSSSKSSKQVCIASSL